MATTTPTEEIADVIDIRSRIGVTSPDQFKYVNLLVYGESGIGKTVLCGTAADYELTAPLLIVDCEGGTASLSKRKNVDVKHARTLIDVQTIFNELFMHNEGWYNTVAVDSLTDIQDVDMRYIMKETKANAKNPENVDIDVPSPREYGKSRTHMRTIVRGFRDLPMNTIITCLDAEIREEGKPTRIRPNLPGKLQGEIPGFMDVVGYYYKDNDNNRMLQLAGTRKVIAKTRFPELGDIMVNPTIPQIWETIHNAR